MVQKRIFLCAVGPDELYFAGALIKNLRDARYEVGTADHPQALAAAKADLIILSGDGRGDFDKEIESRLNSDPKTKIIYLRTLHLGNPVVRHESRRVKFLDCLTMWDELERIVRASIETK